MKPTSTIGFVYVLKSGEHYKIGSSRNPEQRRKSLQAAWPDPVETVYNIESDRYKYFERQLHRRFADKRVRGEWFALSNEDLAYIRSLNPDSGSLAIGVSGSLHRDRLVLATIAEMKYRRLGKFRDIPASEYVPRVEYF